MPLQREHANCPKSLRGTGSKAEQEVHHRIPAQSVPSSPSAPSPCVLPGAESLADPSLYPRNHLCQAPVDHTPKLFMSWAEGQAQEGLCARHPWPFLQPELSDIKNKESFANELLPALLLVAPLPHTQQCPSCQEQGLVQIPSLQRWDTGLVKGWKLQQTLWKLYFLSIQWQLLALPEQSD